MFRGPGTAESVTRGPVSFPWSVSALFPASCEHSAPQMEGKPLSLHKSSSLRAPGLLAGVLSVVGVCVHLHSGKDKRVFIYIYNPGWQC